MKNISKLVRAEILNLKPYSSARSLMTKGELFLDANESGDDNELNRYPEPQPMALKARLSEIYGVPAVNLMIGRGADDAIDALVRVFCKAGRDSVVICPPTYGMYKVAAEIQGASVIEYVTEEKNGFSPDFERIVSEWRDESKLFFLCSPNNPTGNVIAEEDIRRVCEKLLGRAVVVVDEAYVEFSSVKSVCDLNIENLVVLRTLSKAYGLAGARCGVAIARPFIIDLLRKVSAPYPISSPSVSAVLGGLKSVDRRVCETVKLREAFMKRCKSLRVIQKVFKSEANFVLAKFSEPILDKCAEKGIILRDRSNEPGLKGCVRITIGTEEQMERVFAVLSGNELESEERTAKVNRTTNETRIDVAVNLDGKGSCLSETGLGFFDHMLDQLARHSEIDMKIACSGDLEVDEHHTVEDVGLALGEAVKTALGDKVGISRYGFLLPMDDSKAEVALDLGGRSFFKFDGRFQRERVGDLPTELVPHFFRSFSDALSATLHIDVKGDNSHHMVESVFKAVARSLGMAKRVNGTLLPTTKGTL